MKSVVMLIPLLLALPALNIATVYTGDTYTEFLKLYEEATRLAQQGVNVSTVISMLKEVYSYLEENRTGDAAELLNETRLQIDSLEREAPRMIILNNVEKGAVVATLASIPILTYFLLPRIYLYLWYRSRRGWVVKHGHTR